MSTPKQKITIILFFFMLNIVAFSQSGGPCEVSEKHHDLDWRLRKWTYLNKQGEEEGQRVFKKMATGCVIKEEFIYNGKVLGEGHIFYDQKTDTWHQYYFNNSGYTFTATMHFIDGEMVRDGREFILKNGDSVWKRDVFSWDAENQKVHQREEESRDGKVSWKTISSRSDLLIERDPE